MVTIGIIENAFLIRINGGITHSHNEKYREEFEALPFIADNDSPSKEVVLAAKPDLIIGWGSTFTEDSCLRNNRFCGAHYSSYCPHACRF